AKEVGQRRTRLSRSPEEVRSCGAGRSHARGDGGRREALGGGCARARLDQAPPERCNRTRLSCGGRYRGEALRIGRAALSKRARAATEQCDAAEQPRLGDEGAQAAQGARICRT